MLRMKDSRSCALWWVLLVLFHRSPTRRRTVSPSSRQDSGTLPCEGHSALLCSRTLQRGRLPESRSALFAAWPVDSGLTAALTALRVTRLYESGGGVAVTLTAAGARLIAE
ncbi:hypothetical protein EYF80_009694 [Liparis tanakae]|uniref:Secreted protein n=1 Tax=Liparis tanakae TaxID=230148 RepID=A0A4Z2IS73_9TELE|nr:hypothetical protein EYF80_009694 [Liparis tanakae]